MKFSTCVAVINIWLSGAITSVGIDKIIENNQDVWQPYGWIYIIIGFICVFLAAHVVK